MTVGDDGQAGDRTVAPQSIALQLRALQLRESFRSRAVVNDRKQADKDSSHPGTGGDRRVAKGLGVTRSILRLFCGGTALLLSGCAAEYPLSSSDAAAATASRGQSINVAGMDRAQVVAQFGEPWIADPARRVDVFRTSETQKNLLIVFAPWPLPLPSFSRQYSGYSLVSYAHDGIVESVDHAFTVTGITSVSEADRRLVKPTAQAGDYEFTRLLVDASRTLLSVTHARWVKDRAIDARSAAECTLVTVCDNLNKQPRGVCWPQLQVDGHNFGQAIILNASLRHVSTAIRLAPGTHDLSYSSRDLSGNANAQLTCAPGEVWYAHLGGTLLRSYSTAEQFTHGMSSSIASGKVELNRELPPDAEPTNILLYLDGKPLDGKGVP